MLVLDLLALIQAEAAAEDLNVVAGLGGRAPGWQQRHGIRGSAPGHSSPRVEVAPG